MDTVQRILVLTLALSICTLVPAHAQLPSNELEGTWRMVSQELVYPDTVIDQSDRWGPGYKILNSTHFAWGRETEDGESVLAGGGHYEYFPESNVYIEHIQYHSDPALSGMSIKFKARVEGDTWYHIGEVENYRLREVWKRVDPREAKKQLTDRGTTDTSAQTPPPEQ